ncbi:hypothetical protein ACFWQC_22195 [Nocardioides sp. NPDC058538]
MRLPDGFAVRVHDAASDLIARRCLDDLAYGAGLGGRNPGAKVSR